VPGERIGLSTP